MIRIHLPQGKNENTENGESTMLYDFQVGDVLESNHAGYWASVEQITTPELAKHAMQWVDYLPSQYRIMRSDLETIAYAKA